MYATTPSEKAAAESELHKNLFITGVTLVNPYAGLLLSTGDMLINDPKTQLIYKSDLEKRMNEGDYNARKIYQRKYNRSSTEINAQIRPASN